MGGTETTRAPVGRTLPDARQAPPGVDAGASVSRSSGGDGDIGRDTQVRGRDRPRKGGRTERRDGIQQIGIWWWS